MSGDEVKRASSEVVLQHLAVGQSLVPLEGTVRRGAVIVNLAEPQEVVGPILRERNDVRAYVFRHREWLHKCRVVIWSVFDSERNTSIFGLGAIETVEGGKRMRGRNAVHEFVEFA